LDGVGQKIETSLKTPTCKIGIGRTVARPPQSRPGELHPEAESARGVTPRAAHRFRTWWEPPPTRRLRRALLHLSTAWRFLVFLTQPLTEPDLNLSAYPARATVGRLPSSTDIEFLRLPVDSDQYG